MRQIEFKVTINVEDQTELDALNEFLNILKGESKPLKKETTKKETTKKETPKKDSAETESDSAETSYKIEDVRALLSKKVNDHRVAIKEKLTELGAKNVTSMGEEHYPDFIEFLNSL